jgi:hypothetical protein
MYRRNGTAYYAKDKTTGRAEALGTTDRAEAQRLLNAKDQATEQPHLNVAMAAVSFPIIRICSDTGGIPHDILAGVLPLRDRVTSSSSTVACHGVFTPLARIRSRRILTFMNTTKTSIRPSTLIFSCLAAFALVALSGCASDKCHSSTSESSATTMSPDSKDMVHSSGQNSH